MKDDEIKWNKLRLLIIEIDFKLDIIANLRKKNLARS